MAFRASVTSVCDAIKAVTACLLYHRRGGEDESGKPATRLDGSSSSESFVGESIQKAAERIAREFEFTQDDLRRAVKAFIQQLSKCKKSWGVANANP